MGRRGRAWRQGFRAGHSWARVSEVRMRMVSEGAVPGWSAGVIQDRGGPQAEATAGHRPGRQSASWPVVVTPGDGLGLGCPGETGVRAVSPHLCAPLFPAPILTQILLPSEQEGSWDLRLHLPNSGTESGGPSMQTGDRDLRAPSPPTASPQPTPNPGIDSRPPGPSPRLDLGQIDPGGAGTRVLLV